MVVKWKNAQVTQVIRFLHKLPQNITTRTTTTTSSRPSEAIFIERSLEHPIIAITDKENVDIIGPPDAVSNLRPIVRKQCLYETELQHKLRLMQDETHGWNQKFWAEHNTRFIQERKDYVKKHQTQDGTALSAEEMSEFYKKFLDANWRLHVTYNFEWYKRNFSILFLALRSSLPQSLHFIGRN